MTVRRAYSIAAAVLGVLWLSTGCSDRDGAQLTPETDDPYYVQGVQWKRQGRNPEALTSFLKVIDKRGERGAAESHLQAGEIYLNQIKEPVYAYYHFRRYLELQPNSPQSELVRGMVKAALREFAKTLPGAPINEQSVRVQAEEDLAILRRENEQLRAELAVLRGGGASPVKQATRMITAAPQPQFTPITVPTASVADPAAALPARPAPSTAPTIQPAPSSVRATTMTSAGSSAPITARPPAGSAAKTHTVAPKETLFGLSKRFGVSMEELAAANGLPSVNTPLKIGAVLRIPTSGGRK